MTLALDTHAIVRKLQSVGFSEDQAEAVTNVIRDTQDAGISGLATKADLREIEAKIEALRNFGKTDLREVEARLDAKIDKVELRLEAKIEATKSELVRWLVITQAALAGFIFTVLKFLH